MSEHRPSACPREYCPVCNAVLFGAMEAAGLLKPRTGGRRERAADPWTSAMGDVAAILARFRADHGYQPGQSWNPRKGAYEWPGGDAR